MEAVPSCNLVAGEIAENDLEKDMKEGINTSWEADSCNSRNPKNNINILSDIILVPEPSNSEKSLTCNNLKTVSALKVQEKSVNFKKDIINEYTNNILEPNCSSNLFNTVNNLTNVLSPVPQIPIIDYSEIPLKNYSGNIDEVSQMEISTGDYTVDPLGYLSKIISPTEVFSNGTDQHEVIQTSENYENKSDSTNCISPTNSSTESCEIDSCLEKHMFFQSDNEVIIINIIITFCML